MVRDADEDIFAPDRLRLLWERSEKRSAAKEGEAEPEADPGPDAAAGALDAFVAAATRRLGTRLEAIAPVIDRLRGHVAERSEAGRKAALALLDQLEDLYEALETMNA